jgi:hypothetical protein
MNSHVCTTNVLFPGQEWVSPDFEQCGDLGTQEDLVVMLSAWRRPWSVVQMKTSLDWVRGWLPVDLIDVGQASLILEDRGALSNELRRGRTRTICRRRTVIPGVLASVQNRHSNTEAIVAGRSHCGGRWLPTSQPCRCHPERWAHWFARWFSLQGCSQAWGAWGRGPTGSREAQWPALFLMHALLSSA